MQKMANVKSERDRDTLNSETPARYFRDGRIKNPKSCRICKTSDFFWTDREVLFPPDIEKNGCGAEVLPAVSGDYAASLLPFDFGKDAAVRSLSGHSRLRSSVPGFR